MPKKRQSFQHTKPTSQPHPSLSSSSKDASHSLAAATPSNSVNEKLSALRLGTRSADKAAALSSYEPPRPVQHPSVQNILQIPQGAPPRPRPGLRVTGGRRGPAGPPPPGSWLQKTSIMKKTKDGVKLEHGRKKAEVLPGMDLPSPGSLLDQTLRSLARNWEEHVHYDQYYLATIPVRYKAVLLHYIAVQSERAIDVHGLEVLFYDDTELEGATGASGLTHLDLSGNTIDNPLPLKDLKSFFSSPTKLFETAVSTHELPESWDSQPTISEVVSLPKFHALTHLSLAQPSPAATWKDLLNFAPNLRSLTHLSLAFWPTPTLTPNMSTAYAATPTGNVQASATNFYGQYDNDYSEAASIMRRLSKHTICLQWLDLTGCHPWINCLSYKDIDWYGAWAGLETVKIAQGWVPRFWQEHPDFQHKSIVDIFAHFGSHQEYNTYQAELDELARWSDTEIELRSIEHAVRGLIREASLEADRAVSDSLLSTTVPASASSGSRRRHKGDGDWADDLRKKPANLAVRTTRLNFEYETRDHEMYERARGPDDGILRLLALLRGMHRAS